MTTADIANIRLISQQLAVTKFKTVKEITNWMGAIQAQDYAMAKWAIGVRLKDCTDKMVETAIENSDIIRTHLLRPTWHFVSADDIYWLLQLTAPHIKALLKSRHKELELNPTIFIKSNNILEKALTGNNHLTREELLALLKNANINTDDQRGAHLMLQAELDGLICNGVKRNKDQTYALLEERVPKPALLNRDEALAKLAKKYFLSHSPATLKDFVWWSGLSVSNAKLALQMIKSDVISETIDSQTYWFNPSLSVPKIDKSSVYLLPAFDEFLISYKDRSAAIALKIQSKAFTNNGIFKPVIIVNGQVAGIWKRTVKKDKVLIETDFFRPPNRSVKNLTEEASRSFGNFLDKETKISYDLVKPGKLIA